MLVTDHTSLRETITNVVRMVVDGDVIWADNKRYYKYDKVCGKIVTWIILGRDDGKN